MIRRLMLIFGSIVLAAIGFLTYLWWQSPVNPTGGSAAFDPHLHPTSLAATQAGVSGVGAGTGAWMQQYDKDGNLTSTMRADQWIPRPGGNVVDVVEPVCDFFLAGGKKMVLTGDRGVINVEQRGGGKGNALSGGGPDAAPTSGFLYNVVVKLYEPAAPDHATMTMTTNNISFDNQTFKFATETFTDSYGKEIKADQVPVQIRGDDIDFDGKGLIARYDDLNQRIAMLEIKHGDTMVVKKTDLMKTGEPKPTTRTTAAANHAPGASANAGAAARGNASPTAGAAAYANGSPAAGEAARENATPVAGAGQVVALANGEPAGDASTDVRLTPSPGTPGEGRGEGSAAKAEASSHNQTPPTDTPGKPHKSATKPAEPKSVPTAYRATFLDDVHVSKDDAPMADADILAIDFFPEQNGDHATTKPASPAPAGSGVPMKSDASSTASSAPASADTKGGFATPTTKPHAGGASPIGSSADASHRHALPTTAVTQASTKPSTNPTTQPGPMVIHWTGTLRVIAVENKTVVPLLPGENAIAATGAPLVLYLPPNEKTGGVVGSPTSPTSRPTQGIIHCGSMLYASHDSSVKLETSNAVPTVTFVSAGDAAQQTTLVTQHVDYSDATKLAVLTGISNLHMVQPPKQAGQPATNLTATWDKTCTAKLFPGNAVQQIDLLGDVDVQHPQMKMKSSALSLAFKPNAADASKSDLERITATGLVDCDMSTPLTPNRTLKGEKVIVGTTVGPDGNVFPQTLDAAGSVLATDGDQLISSDTMHATLGPKATTQPTAATPPMATASANAHRTTGRAHNAATAGELKPGVASSAAPAGGSSIENPIASGGGSAAESAASNSTGGATTSPAGGALALNTGRPTTRPHRGTTRPTTGPSDNVAEQGELKSFHATGSVVMLSKDGKATADDVMMDQSTGHQVIELRGTPASLTQQGRTITGPLITARPDDGLAKVEGPGTLHAMEESAPKPASPVGAKAAPGNPSAAIVAPPAAGQAADAASVTPHQGASAVVPPVEGATAAPVVPQSDASTAVSSVIGAAGSSPAVAGASAATTKPATTKPSGRPIDLAWSGGANFDGPSNLITFTKDIVVHTIDADGTKRVATSDLMTVNLKPAPATQPSGKSTSTTQPTRRPSTRPGAATKPTTPGAPNAFKDKIVSAVNLSGHVNVQSTLETPAGLLVRRTLLLTEKLTANLDDQQQLSSVDIPVPGQALIDDRKTATTRPTTRSTTRTATTKPADSNDGGATAVEWKKSFHMDEGVTPVATLTGNVWVHHDPIAGPGADSVDLTSSKVIVTFAPQNKPPTTRPTTPRPPVAGATTTRPTGRPATRPSEPELGIQQIYAAAPVTFKARDVVLNAQALQYTPDTHMVLVSGTDREPVVWTDGNEKAKGQFQQVWYNAETQLVEDWTGVTVQGGK